MGDGLDIDVALKRGDFCLSIRKSIPAEGITAISGPSGSGKTTLLRVIAGLEEGATGRVSLAGSLWQDEQTFVAPHKRRIGMVFQEPRLFPHLDVRANLMYGAARRGADWASVLPIVRAFDVENLLHRRVRGLSGGEQRRVALARALAMRPSLLCLDEPLTGLDEARKADLLPYLARAVSQVGCPTLYVSHHGEEIAALADRVLYLAKGTAQSQAFAPVPECFDLPVVDVRRGRLVFEMGGSKFGCPGDGEAGQVRRIHIPARSCLVSRSDPGVTSGVAKFVGRIERIDPDRGRVAISVGAHMFELPLTGDDVRRLALELGAEVFVLPLEVTLMPDRHTVA